MNANELALIDRRMMARALQLAARGMYSAHPNPRVGCVLARGDRIIGEGWHEIAGERHAEVAALQHATEEPAGATAYVTLEPCCFEGLTAACSQALIAAKISRVVAAMQDPHPRVSGKGVAELRGAGIEVVTPLMENEAAALNPGFIKRYRKGVPFVRCKLAMSVDGRTALANGASRWVSGPAARQDTQRIRARSSAIVTGIGTVLADNPAMTVRANELNVARPELALRKQPLRVVLDSRLRIPLEATILNPPGDRIVFTETGSTDKGEELRRRGVEVVELAGGGRVDLGQVLRFLAERKCNEVLVEAGPTLAGAFLRDGLIDELVIYVAPKLMGDKARPLFVLPELGSMDAATGLSIREVRQVGDDIRITATCTEEKDG